MFFLSSLKIGIKTGGTLASKKQSTLRGNLSMRQEGSVVKVGREIVVV